MYWNEKTWIFLSLSVHCKKYNTHRYRTNILWEFVVFHPLTGIYSCFKNNYLVDFNSYMWRSWPTFWHVHYKHCSWIFHFNYLWFADAWLILFLCRYFQRSFAHRFTHWYKAEKVLPDSPALLLIFIRASLCASSPLTSKLPINTLWICKLNETWQ